ncbi:MAG: hypothetical protein Kow00124_15160 [Anaerolineae bacterium]
MKTVAARAAMPVVGVVLLALLTTGCTLSGAGAAPLTPVGPDTIQPTPVQPTPTDPGVTLPTPTEFIPPDVFATQTAQAMPTPEGGAAEETPPAAETIVPPVEATPLPTEEPPAGEATPAPGDQVGACQHVVAAGENLFRIALRYGVTTDELAAANGIANPDAIAVGVVLIIPGCGEEGAGTDTGTDTTAGGDILHVVAEGENLYRIALKYGQSWQALAAYNGITNPESIVVGQTIRIPASEQ